MLATVVSGDGVANGPPTVVSGDSGTKASAKAADGSRREDLIKDPKHISKAMPRRCKNLPVPSWFPGKVQPK